MTAVAWDEVEVAKEVAKPRRPHRRVPDQDRKKKVKPPRPPAPEGGRPKGRFNPNIDWKLAEKLYVEGELQGEAEHTERVYLSVSLIADRAGTTCGNMEQRIGRYGWREKREAFQTENRIIHGSQPDVIAPAKDGRMSRKPLKRDPEAILKAYIDLFATAVERRTIRYDCVADLDKAIRLLAFVRGQAESTKHTHVTVTLDAMQRRHHEYRALVAARVDDDVAGVLGGGAPYDEPEAIDVVGLPSGWDDEGGPVVPGAAPAEPDASWARGLPGG